MKILVLTPGRGSVCIEQRDMLMRLALRLHKRGDAIEMADETTPGFLHHSRNVLLGTLAARTQIDWGLWLDTDVSFDPDAVLAMSLRPESLISWNYPVRIAIDVDYPPERLISMAKREKTRRRWVGVAKMSNWAGRTWSADGKLLELDHNAFGAVLMRREVATEMRRVLGHSSPDWNSRAIVPGFDLIQNRVGEDYSFCRRYRQVGGRIWCDPSVYVTNGQTGGRFADHIARCDAYVRELPRLACYAR